MFCFRCGAKIPKNTKYCHECGSTELSFQPPQGNPVMNCENASHAPFVDRSASIADELIKLKGLLDAGVLTQAEFDAQKAKLLAGSSRAREVPYAIPVAPPPQPYGETQPPKKLGRIVAPLIILIMVASIIIIAIVSPGENASSDKTPLMKAMNVTKDQEAEMLSVFKACGILDIKKVEVFQTGEQSTSYYAIDIETAYYGHPIVIWIYNDSKKVEAIYYEDNTIYEKGKVKSNIQDYYIDAETRSGYQLLAETLVKECLNYPNSAKFKYGSSNWAFKKEKGKVTIQSSVNAKNAFGVDSDMKFQIVLGKDGTPKSFILDGKEYLK